MSSNGSWANRIWLRFGDVSAGLSQRFSLPFVCLSSLLLKGPNFSLSTPPPLFSPVFFKNGDGLLSLGIREYSWMHGWLRRPGRDVARQASPVIMQVGG